MQYLQKTSLGLMVAASMLVVVLVGGGNASVGGPLPAKSGQWVDGIIDFYAAIPPGTPFGP